MSEWTPMFEGVKRQTIASGAQMMQMKVALAAGSRVPEHQHPHEQITHVASGRLRFLIAGEPHEVGAGESICLAGNVLHAVEALEESLAVDTFSPPREDLLAQDRGERRAASPYYTLLDG